MIFIWEGDELYKSFLEIKADFKHRLKHIVERRKNEKIDNSYCSNSYSNYLLFYDCTCCNHIYIKLGFSR